MTAEAEPLAAAFTAPGYADWEALVDAPRPLVAEIEPGLNVRWLYGPEDALAPDPAGAPGAAPFTRGRRLGTPWAIRQACATPDRGRAHREILDDLEGGATELLLTLGADGIPVADDDELAEVLDGVDLELAPVALAGGAQAAGLLLERWRRCDRPPATLRGSLRLDPIGGFARSGARDPAALAPELDAALRRVSEVHAEFPRVRTLAVDTSPYVEAGAGAVTELGLALATGVDYLRAGDRAGISADAVAATLEFTVVAGPDQFLEIAKLRALRRLWAGVLAACEVAPERRVSVVRVTTSRRMASALDPWVNLLRATTAAFAAAVAGADGITVVPFDEPIAEPGPLGRRMARNTQLVLLHEAALHRVADPAGGSWYVESLTDELTRAGWARLQAIERAGGIAAALAGGEVARGIAAERDARHAAIARRERILTGVNAFPLLGDDGLERADAPSRDEALTTEIDETMPPGASLAPSRDAAAFEALRARALGIAAERGVEPTILLACPGPLAAHGAVEQWARGIFASGGVAAITAAAPADGSAAALVAEHGLTEAAICAGRDVPDAERASLVDTLRAAGVRHVSLAGADDAAARAIGADAGVAEGIDVVAVLGALLDRLEAPR